jgi:predicted DNA-binding transcriptional regulator YafY
MMVPEKSNRTLEMFFRGIRGEDLSPAKLALRYGVSTKSITRSINEIKDFLAENRELVGHTELEYSHTLKAYHLVFDEFLSDKELFAIAKVMIGSRAFSENDTSLIVSKLKRFTSLGDRKKLDELIRKELYHYSEVKHDCASVIETLWRLVGVITEKAEITISYYNVERILSEKRIQPVSLMFSEYYFYLIAYYPGEYDEPRYFRVDRITDIVEHRKRFDPEQVPGFNEGELRKRSQFMFYGKLRQVRFWYSGPSVQAILDRLPTAKIIERGSGRYLLEAEVYGDGIKMFLLSQGTWVRVVAPDDFVVEMGNTAKEIAALYQEGER